MIPPGVSSTANTDHLIKLYPLRRFSATIDSLSRTLTFVVLVVIVIPFITIGKQYLTLHDPLLLIGPVVVVLILAAAALLRVREYGLDTAGLHIVRQVRPVTIPLGNIKGISSITSKELGPGVRALGSGGFLGYFGRFYYRDHGWITLYATDRSKMILLTLTNDRQIIISPDDTAGFVAAFNDLKRK